MNASPSGHGTVTGVQTYPLSTGQEGTVDLGGLPGEFWAYHAHEWDRFVISSPTHTEAAEIAARLGWWLHCWTWAAAGHYAITDHGKPEDCPVYRPAGW